MSARLPLSSLILVAALAGCATPQNQNDPLEGINRPIYRFNTAVDQALLRPLSQAYTAVVPAPARHGVHNFFGNLNDIWIGINNLLQGKPKAAVSDWGRVLINSTVGVAGLVDVASKMDLEKHDEDLGQTLAVWGVGNGPYLVLPFLGSTTLRDSTDLIAEHALYQDMIPDNSTRDGVTALRILDVRAQLLGVDHVISEAGGLDEYAFIRDAYLQRRASLAADGATPATADEDDPGPTPEPATPATATPATP
ncbi:VacJ family lipoprotein [Leeia sp.]|uniref:MlaA family lipoprotein n=1 Tax=Leeia sp. TaxID=2884678 RepID=UPI0035AFF6F3